MALSHYQRLVVLLISSSAKAQYLPQLKLLRKHALHIFAPYAAYADKPQDIQTSVILCLAMLQTAITSA